jgi:hypothetical protein
VFLPAIVGYVPEEMVRCIRAFLDFCYLARRPAHYTSTLAEMEAALARFHHYREVFRREGLWINNEFSFPRQHALVHYVLSIKLFGSPNGICSSITESKHIRAVKRPYRRSSKYKPLGQILRTNTRLSKLASAAVLFKTAGMLIGTAIDSARIELGLDDDDNEAWEVLDDEEGEAMDEDGEAVESKVELAQRHGA